MNITIREEGLGGTLFFNLAKLLKDKKLILHKQELHLLQSSRKGRTVLGKKILTGLPDGRQDTPNAYEFHRKPILPRAREGHLSYRIGTLHSVSLSSLLL